MLFSVLYSNEANDCPKWLKIKKIWPKTNIKIRSKSLKSVDHHHNALSKPVLKFSKENLF